MKRDDSPGDERRSVFQRLVRKREGMEVGRRLEQRHSLEGLRLSALMKQMQALQAVQGLTELAPRKDRDSTRFAIPTDEEERKRHRQWLEYKADWLQAVLEDTLNELEALDRYESEPPGGGDRSPDEPSETVANRKK